MFSQTANRWISYLAITALLSGYFAIFSVNHVSVQAQEQRAESATLPANIVPNQLVVKFKAGVDGTQVIAAKKGKVVDRSDFSNIYTVQIPANTTLAQQLSVYNADRRVQYAETVNKGRVLNTAFTNDTHVGLQWSIKNMKVDTVWADETNGTKGSADVVIAVIDSGVDKDHPDLQAKLLEGRSTVVDVNYAEGSDTDDKQGHGTHVAGTAAAIANNSAGVAGICQNCAILPIRAMNSTGSGVDTDVREGIEWVTNYAKSNPTKKVIMNMSIGFENYSQSVQDAINDAYNNGILIVAAMGNTRKANIRYPAAYNNVVAVASTGAESPAVIDNSSTALLTDTRSGFSTMGAHADLAAPGSHIYSTTYDGGYGYMQGTSMATPNVAGVAGLVWSKRSDLNNYQLEWLLKSTARKATAIVKGAAVTQLRKDTSFGYGIVDAQAAISATGSTFASTITGLTVTPTTFNRTTTFSFNATGSGYFTAKVYQADGKTFVRTLAEDALISRAGVVRINWDARNNAKAFVADGNYVVRIGIKYEGGNAAFESRTVTVDRTVSLTSFSVDKNTIDTTKTGPAAESSVLTFVAGEKLAASVAIVDANNKIVRTLGTLNEQVDSGVTSTRTWNGTNATNSTKVTDGNYKFLITTADTIGNRQTFSVDVRATGNTPTITIPTWRSFKPAFPITNIGRAARASFPYMLSEPAKTVTIEVSRDGTTFTLSQPSPVVTQTNFTNLPSGMNVFSWNGYFFYADMFGGLGGYSRAGIGTYTVKITATDLDNNTVSVNGLLTIVH